MDTYNLRLGVDLARPSICLASRVICYKRDAATLWAPFVQKWGNRCPFADQETIGGDAQGGVVMEAKPRPSKCPRPISCLSSW